MAHHPSALPPNIFGGTVGGICALGRDAYLGGDPGGGERLRMSQNAMRRLSYYLLVLLTLYASLAGAA